MTPSTPGRVAAIAALVLVAAPSLDATGSTVAYTTVEYRGTLPRTF